ncbi:MAG: sigma 54-interacting transcriptional regulator [Kofleriaceae bacterium]
MDPSKPHVSRSETEAEIEPLAPVRKFQLRIVEGIGEGTRHTGIGERTVVGTDPSTDFRLSDPTVSRTHCELVLADGKVLIRDLGSRNGTFVNGVSIVAAHLSTGSIVRIGRTELTFDAGRADTAVARSDRDRFGSLVGRSPAMQKVFAVLEQAAASDVTVLIHGETGTGKDLAATSIHNASERRNGPLIVVDCSAISTHLLESELFGHERGAYTGADKSRAGVFESAAGGTIFLDEIGELGLDLQPKLLRVLEQREVRRVGGTQVIPLDVRIIAATNRDLAAEVKAGRFRSDLYYRLMVAELTMPPLRERPQDLPLLVRAILEQLGAEASRDALFGRPEFIAELYKHSWPGNARELRNYLSRCISLQQYVAPAILGEVNEDASPVDVDVPLRELRERWIEKFEKIYLEKILLANANNVTSAARAAGLNRAHFHRLLARHGLRGK